MCAREGEACLCERPVMCLPVTLNLFLISFHFICVCGAIHTVGARQPLVVTFPLRVWTRVIRPRSEHLYHEPISTTLLNVLRQFLAEPERTILPRLADHPSALGLCKHPKLFSRGPGVRVQVLVLPQQTLHPLSQAAHSTLQRQQWPSCLGISYFLVFDSCSLSSLTNFPKAQQMALLSLLVASKLLSQND